MTKKIGSILIALCCAFTMMSCENNNESSSFDNSSNIGNSEHSNSGNIDLDSSNSLSGNTSLNSGNSSESSSDTNDLSYMLNKLLAFDDGIKVALEWANGRNDTVVIVTADHETGGLNLKEGITQANMFQVFSLNGGMTYTPNYYEWTTDSHTDREVYCYINGANIDFTEFECGSTEKICNTDIFTIVKNLMKE